MNLKYNCANTRGMGVLNGSPCILIPGVNRLPDSHWEQWRSHPEISQLVEDGKIVVLNDEAADRAAAKMAAEMAKVREERAEKERAELEALRGARDAEKAPAKTPAAKAAPKADDEDPMAALEREIDAAMGK